MKVFVPHHGFFLTFSDDTCQLAGERHRDVPLLLTASGKPVDVVSSWFRYMAKAGKRRTGLRQTARIATVFWRWLRTARNARVAGAVVGRSLPWTQVTDATLFAFRGECLKRGNADKTVNGKISVVLRFYWWAQEHSYIRDQIGNGKREDGTDFPIQITRYQVRGRWYITSDVLLECHTGKRLPIPTDADIDNAFVRLAENNDEGLRTRNVLLFNWVLDTGVRRFELLSLKLIDLPSENAIPRADGRWEVQVTGKGGNVRTIFPSNELVEATRDYWDNERKFVVKSNIFLKGPDEIFIGHVTGKVLNVLSERQVNRIFKDAFIDAALKLHPHRVRAKFANDFLNENVDAEVGSRGFENVRIDFLLDALAQVLGHADKRTLRRYVQIRLRWHALGFAKLSKLG